MDFGPVVVEAVAVAVLDDERRGQERREEVADGDRAGAGAARAVRAGEGLVDVVVHHVRAEVAGPA